MSLPLLNKYKCLRNASGGVSTDDTEKYESVYLYYDLLNFYMLLPRKGINIYICMQYVLKFIAVHFVYAVLSYNYIFIPEILVWILTSPTFCCCIVKHKRNTYRKGVYNGN